MDKESDKEISNNSASSRRGQPVTFDTAFLSHKMTSTNLSNSTSAVGLPAEATTEPGQRIDGRAPDQGCLVPSGKLWRPLTG